MTRLDEVSVERFLAGMITSSFCGSSLVKPERKKKLV